MEEKIIIEEKELKVQHGIWIEENWIRNANLGSLLKVNSTTRRNPNFTHS